MPGWFPSNMLQVFFFFNSFSQTVPGRVAKRLLLQDDHITWTLCLRTIVSTPKPEVLMCSWGNTNKCLITPGRDWWQVKVQFCSSLAGQTKEMCFLIEHGWGVTYGEHRAAPAPKCQLFLDDDFCRLHRWGPPPSANLPHSVWASTSWDTI